MNIGFALDINLVLPLINTLYSILFNNKNNIIFYLIVDDDNTKNMILNNLHLLSNFLNYTTNIKIMKDSDKEFFSKYDRRNSELRKDIHTIHYCQLLFGEYFDDLHKLLYLEADQIINGNISELYETHNIAEKGICAVPELPIPKFISEYIGKETNFEYFNCGVTLLNLNYWKNNDILNKCKEILIKNFQSEMPIYEYCCLIWFC